MGYTHYWNRDNPEIPQQLWNDALVRIKPLIESNVARFGLQDVEVDGDHIFFNGQCETFHVQRVFRSYYADRDPAFAQSMGCFRFCKTRGDKYDPLVVAVLVLLADTFKGTSGFRWSSDGDLGDHYEGFKLAGINPETAPHCHAGYGAPDGE